MLRTLEACCLEGALFCRCFPSPPFSAGSARATPGTSAASSPASAATPISTSVVSSNNTAQMRRHAPESMLSKLPGSQLTKVTENTVTTSVHQSWQGCASQNPQQIAQFTGTCQLINSALTFCCIALCHQCEVQIVQLLHLLNICQLIRLELQTLHTTPTEVKDSQKNSDGPNWGQNASVSQKSIAGNPACLGDIVTYGRSLDSLQNLLITRFEAL